MAGARRMRNVLTMDGGRWTMDGRLSASKLWNADAAHHLAGAVACPFCLVDEVVLEMSCSCRGYTDLLFGKLWVIMKQDTRTFQG